MANKGPFPSATVDPPHRRPAQFPVTGRGEGDGPAPSASPKTRGAAAKNLAILQALVGKGKSKGKAK